MHNVVVTGIIIKDNKFLITKRSSKEKRWPNKWTVPGGKLEPDYYKHIKKDTPHHWYNVLEKTLKREVKEETGLDIKNIRYLTSLSFLKEDGSPTIVISLFGDYYLGELKLNKESSDFAWVTLEEAKNYDLIDGIYEELEMLDKILKNKSVEEWTK